MNLIKCTVKHKLSAFKVNMGGLLLDQVLPSGQIDHIDPVLLIHHMKRLLPPNEKQVDQGVGPHPHRGFSPVTFVIKGAVKHRDSRGNSSTVHKGGVQWMNSGMGIIHSERPDSEFLKEGGLFEIIQIWINTPAAFKMQQPEYFPVEAENIPSITSENGSELKVVAGTYMDVSGVIPTKSPMDVMILELKKDTETNIAVKADFSSMVYVVEGGIKSDNHSGYTGDMFWFNNDGNNIALTASSNSHVIFISAQPIGEPIETQGPFVMNTATEILQALRDYQMGKMGFLVEEFEE